MTTITTLLILLQLLDAVTTFYALKDGKNVEMNPIINKFIKDVGLIPALVVSKGVGVIAAFMLTPYPVVQTVLGFVYLYVVVNNCKATY